MDAPAESNEGLIEVTECQMVSLNHWDGICDYCSGTVHLGESTITRFCVLLEQDEANILIPINFTVHCPHCNAGVKAFRIWKNLEVTKELEEMKHASS